MIPNICELVGRDKKHLVQYCLPIEKAKDLQFPVIASEKLDGCYGLVYFDRDNKEVYIYSRTGEPYISLKHLHPHFMEIALDTSYDIFICELYAKGLSQPTISGYCRDTKNQHEEIHAYVHDGMTFEDFKDSWTDTNQERAVYLKNYFLSNYFNDIHFIPFRFLRTMTGLQNFADEIWSLGGEGVVAKQAFKGYEAGSRSASMVKLKQHVSFDLKVVSLQGGRGKYEGMLGYLVCEDKNGTKVKVGSGLTDKQRKWWWTEWGYHDILNKIVQIDAMSISKKGVLREPRFKGIRTDKVEVDSLL